MTIIKGTYNLTLIIENSDGISTNLFFDFVIERAQVEAWVIGVEFDKARDFL